MKYQSIGVFEPKTKFRIRPIAKLMTALTFASLSQISMAQLLVSNSPVEGIDRILSYNSSTAIPNQYIIVFKDSYVVEQVQSLMIRRGQLTEPQARESIVRDMSIDLATLGQGNIERTYSAAINGFVLASRSAKAVARLSLDSRIDFVEMDQTVSIDTTQNNATWGLDRIDQVNLPLNNTYIYNQNGSGVTAYIIDTGVRQSHTQFGGRASGGFTAINDGNGTNDCNGHGTHVAGTVGSSTYGVAKNVNIVAVRVLGCTGSGSNSGVIAGINWVAANHTNRSVANMSLGGGASKAVNHAANGAVASGVTMVVAAGNNSSNACNFSPASAAKVITVGSTASNDWRSSFSNFGTCLDIFAPGSSITSTWATSNNATNTISGTSMASPHVAGVAALYLDENPSATPAKIQAAIESAAGVNKVIDARAGSPNLLLNTSNLFQVQPTPDEFDDISIRGYSDDIPGDAERLFSGASAQDHNFHDAGDQDWTIFALGHGQGANVKTYKLGAASARIAVYRLPGLPTAITPDRWNIPLSDLTLIGSDNSSGNNSVLIQNTSGVTSFYVVKTTSSGPVGDNTDYQLLSLVANPLVTPDQFDNVSVRGFNDDIPGNAERLFSGASAQDHNFHDAGDQDWTIFALGHGQGANVKTFKLGVASARIAVYRLPGLPTAITPDRWNIPLSDLTLIGSDNSSGNNSVLIQNTSGVTSFYVVKTTSSGPVGVNTDYQLLSVVANP